MKKILILAALMISVLTTAHAANEGTLTVKMVANKNGAKSTFQPATMAFDITGDIFSDIIVTIGVAEETIDIGDIGTLGYVGVHNLGTNAVTIGPNAPGGTNVVGLIKLEGGDYGVFRASTNVLRAIATPDVSNVRFLLIED
jgi:hypothetical protein